MVSTISNHLNKKSNVIARSPYKQQSNRKTMATIPPADITTMPGSKVIFNAPFDDKRTYYVKVIEDVNCFNEITL